MLIAALAMIAVASPDGGTLDRVHLAIDSATGTAMLSLAISSQQLTAHEGSTTIELPHGTHVIGMSTTIGAATSVAKLVTSERARAQFNPAVAGTIDPALLELTDATASVDRFALRVYPLGARSTVRVELQLELPALTRVALVADTSTSIEIDGEAAAGTRADLPSRTRQAGPRRRRVSMLTSLVASGGVPARPLVVIARTPEPLWCGFGRH